MSMKTILINGAISMMVALITALITSQCTLHREISKIIYDKREKVYIDCYELLHSLKENPYLVFNYNDYILSLKDVNVQLNIYGTKKIVNIFKTIYKNILDKYNDYSDKFSGEKAELIKLNEKEFNHKTDEDLEKEENSYIEKNLFKNEEIDSYIEKLTNAIRKDMRTGRK